MYILYIHIYIYISKEYDRYQKHTYTKVPSPVRKPPVLGSYQDNNCLTDF